MKNSETKSLVSGLLVMLFSVIAFVGISAAMDKSSTPTAYADDYSSYSTTAPQTTTTEYRTTITYIYTYPDTSTSIGIYNGILRYAVYHTQTVTILDCKSNISEELEIPETINNMPVDRIGVGAFSKCSELDSIILPESIEKLSNLGYFNSNLKKIVIKNPSCEIYQHWDTIPDGTVIYGYENSTAQQYAQAFGKEFVIFDGQSTGTTPPVTTTPPTTEIFGDIDGSGIVDASDASIILAYYAYTSTGGTADLREFIKTME